MESTRPKTPNIQISRWLKLIRYLAGLTHCSAILLCAASVVRVGADEFTNASDLKRTAEGESSSTVASAGHAVTDVVYHIQPVSFYLGSFSTA
jgi:hypothetical protein